MDSTLQNIIAISALVLALLFLIRKYVWKPKTTNGKDCGDSSCGC